MKTSENLIERLRKELGLKISKTSKIERLRPGYWQRSAGAWRWHIDNHIGSEETMTDLVKAKKLSMREHFSDVIIEIDE
jgi:hypothetical protein